MGKPDSRSAGRSKLVPFIPGEDASSRHARRLAENLKAGSALHLWCKDAGVFFVVKNGGHHWWFKQGTKLAEWWPSSAKFVIDQQWDRGTHVHDFEQAMRLLKKHFGNGAAPATAGTRLMNKTLDHAGLIRQWAITEDVQLAISKDGEHWRFRKGAVTAEWQPTQHRVILSHGDLNVFRPGAVDMVLHILKTHFTKAVTDGKENGNKPADAGSAAHGGKSDDSEGRADGASAPGKEDAVHGVRKGRAADGEAGHG